MIIKKRTTIDNTIFKELKDKYPPVSAKNGVLYKQTLDYVTFETDFITDYKLRDLRKKHGNDIIAVIIYLRTEMCNGGWKVRVDGKAYEYLKFDCAHNCDIREDIVDAMIQDLIQSQIFFSVEDESFEKGIWLTCPQQVYNYEMACHNRQLSRLRTARNRAQHCPLVPTGNEASADTDDPFGLFSA